MMIQNLWDIEKAVLIQKLIAIQFYLRKQEKSQVNNVTLHLKQLDRQIKLKVIRRKEITKTRAEIIEIETKRTITKINETKSWFFGKVNKIDKSLARLIKKKGRGLKSIKLEMKKKLQLTPQKYKNHKRLQATLCQ